MHTITPTDNTTPQPPSQSSSTTSFTSQRFPFLSETSSKPILAWHLNTFHTQRTTPAALCRDLDAAALGRPSPSSSRSSSGLTTASDPGPQHTLSAAALGYAQPRGPRRLRCARIPIPRGASRIDVKQRDLYEEPERSRYAGYPNQLSSVASVGLPRDVWLRRLLFGQFDELYVISPEGSSSGSSEASSEGGSPT